MFMQLETNLHKSSNYLFNEDVKNLNDLFPKT